MHFLILHHRSGDPVTSKSSPHVRESKTVSIKHGLRTADYGLRTGYKIRTRYKTRTRKYGLGIKHGQGIKRGLRIADWVKNTDYGLLW